MRFVFYLCDFSEYSILIDTIHKFKKKPFPKLISGCKVMFLLFRILFVIVKILPRILLSANSFQISENYTVYTKKYSFKYSFKHTAGNKLAATARTLGIIRRKISPIP